MAKIRAVVKLPNRNPVVILIDNSVDAIQRQLGGKYESYKFNGNCVLLYNPNVQNRFDAKRNIRFQGCAYFGPVVFARHDMGEYYESLSDEEAEQIRRMIKAT